jgi:hypothetical protein
MPYLSAVSPGRWENQAYCGKSRFTNGREAYRWMMQFQGWLAQALDIDVMFADQFPEGPAIFLGGFSRPGDVSLMGQ